MGEFDERPPGHRHQHRRGLGPIPEGYLRLGEMRPGQRGRIQRLTCGRKLKRRLMDMGVVTGTPFEVERVAPLGDPVELRIMGTHISLRREEAGNIWVEVEVDEG